MSDSNKSSEFFINEILLLKKENEELKKKLSVYEKKEQEQNQKTIEIKESKPQMNSYEKQQMQLDSLIRHIARKQGFGDNYRS